MKKLVDGKVSVITPAYNAEKFIADTIESVLNQTYEDFELIIVDDCSNDRTEEIVRSYMEKDVRIQYKKLNGNSGAAVVRNTAIDMAEGRYLAFLDSDDIWDKTKLEKQLNFMKEKKVEFTFSSYRLMSEDGKLLNKEINVPKTITYKGLLKNTIIGCLTVILDRKEIGDIKMPNIRAGQDTATWLSILKKGYVAYGYNEVLASYRLVKGSISNNKVKALKRTWNTYRNVENLGLMVSGICFVSYAFNAVMKRI
ncbi:MAG: glycosyltransferase family 2 protein [Sarcina sp.]